MAAPTQLVKNTAQTFHTFGRIFLLSGFGPAVNDRSGYRHRGKAAEGSNKLSCSGRGAPIFTSPVLLDGVYILNDDPKRGRMSGRRRPRTLLNRVTL
jgi:hypothetical protein